MTIMKFSCPVCQMNPSGMVWEMLPNDNGVLVNTPFLEFDYCIMSPFNKQNKETGKASWKRCRINVLLVKDFDWDEWRKYIDDIKGMVP